jgi:hypothetical protein
LLSIVFGAITLKDKRLSIVIAAAREQYSRKRPKVVKDYLRPFDELMYYKTIVCLKANSQLFALVYVHL